MDPSVIALLHTNDLVKQVFSEVLKRRRVQLRDLRESLVDSPQFGLPSSGGSAAANEGRAQDPVVQEKIEDAVQKLKDAKLIDERQAPIRDFSTYYVTANGLNAERDLRLAAPREQALLPNR
jgi:hypothetical protein